MNGELSSPGDLLPLMLLPIQCLLLFGRIIILILLGFVILEVLSQHPALKIYNK